jgi:hypothetical protein
MQNAPRNLHFLISNDISFLDNCSSNHRLHSSLDYLTPMEYKEKRKLQLDDSESKNSYEFVTTNY